MSGRVRLKENGVLDEEFTLLEIVFKYLSKNLVIYDLSTTEKYFIENVQLNGPIVIPNEICDRWVVIVVPYQPIKVLFVKLSIKQRNIYKNSLMLTTHYLELTLNIKLLKVDLLFFFWIFYFTNNFKWFVNFQTFFVHHFVWIRWYYVRMLCTHDIYKVHWPCQFGIWILIHQNAMRRYIIFVMHSASISNSFYSMTYFSLF